MSNDFTTVCFNTSGRYPKTFLAGGFCPISANNRAKPSVSPAHRHPTARTTPPLLIERQTHIYTNLAQCFFFFFNNYAPPGLYGCVVCRIANNLRISKPHRMTYLNRELSSIRFLFKSDQIHQKAWFRASESAPPLCPPDCPISND